MNEQILLYECCWQAFARIYTLRGVPGWLNLFFFVIGKLNALWFRPCCKVDGNVAGPNSFSAVPCVFTCPLGHIIAASRTSPAVLLSMPGLWCDDATASGAECS